MLFYAIILGIVEGITEFLPISSTGHLIIMDELLGFKGPAGKVFEISIQLGAILSVCWLYRQKLWDVAKTLPSSKSSQHFAVNIAIAFLPAAVIGLLFHHFITTYLFSVKVVACTFILGGIAIIIIEKIKPPARVMDLDSISVKNALLVGIFQCLAMVPGVSRSGATIMGALMLGIDRKTAAEFSFFLAIPTMFAATLYDFYKNYHDLTTDGLSMIAVGFVVAFFSALLVVKWFIGFISKHGFVPFAWYRIAAGAITLALIAMH